MGQTLSAPVTEKHTTTITRGKKYWVGLSEMQGWRIHMEDSHSVHLYLPPGPLPSPLPPSDLPEQPAGSTVSNYYTDRDGHAFAALFDGHGGSAAAKYAGTTLHNRLAELDSYKEGDYKLALKEMFLKTDEDLRADPTFLNDPSGCTAVVALLTAEGEIVVSNIGDSRCVLGYKGQAKAMSNDHKPTDKDETARITAAGGFVEFGRVNGNLALSRALGDFEFKKNFTLPPEQQIVTADPEIITHKLDGEEEFLVLACDGIWDCLSSQQVIDFTRRAVANGDSLAKICEDMMTKCLARDSDTGGIGCDNMTVIIVALLNGRTPEEWQAWVRQRVEKKVGWDTPIAIPDVFGPGGAAAATNPFGGLTGAGFRVTGAGGFANIASILNASGITFKQVDDDSDDEEDSELHIIGEEDLKNAAVTGTPDKLSAAVEPADGYLDDKALNHETKPVDVTEKLEDYERDNRRSKSRPVDDDGDSAMDSGDESDSTTTGPTPVEIPPVPAASAGDSPIPPSFTSIGSPEVPTHTELQRLPKQEKVAAPPQLKSDPSGDEYPAAAKIEGLLDTSESPA